MNSPMNMSCPVCRTEIVEREYGGTCSPGCERATGTPNGEGATALIVLIVLLVLVFAVAVA